MNSLIGVSYKLKNALSVKKGSVLGAILLLSGSCIGVGMLALPILTGFAGALPTFVVMILSWFYMTATALLLLEALQGVPRNTNIVSLAQSCLGTTGKWVAWTTFLFLFYSLIIAYILKGGELLQQYMVDSLRLDSLPSVTGSLVITVGSGLFIYWGTRAVDLFNRICMYLLFLAYYYFMSQCLVLSDAENLMHIDWSYSLFIVPFIVTSFGFHNMIPTINEYLEGSREKLFRSISIAGLLVFAIYAFWTISIHSMIPLYGEISIDGSFKQGEIATQALIRLTDSPGLGIAVVALAFFAIITSLLGQSLSLFDFISDGLGIPKNLFSRILICVLIFAPSYLFSQLFPQLFFAGLEFAGGIATMILFGILPSLMVWVNRYTNPKDDVEAILPGGKWSLIIIISISLVVIIYEIQKHLNF